MIPFVSRGGIELDNQSILLEIKDGVAIITLNQPESMNSFTEELVAGFKDQLERIQSDQSIRAVIITGTGKAFCAGGNVKGFPGTNAVSGRRYLTQGHRLLLQLVALEKPVIAAVNGYAFGAGFNLALACDLVLASDNATFAQVFNKVGMVPDFGGLFFLPRIVGLARAKELMFTGRTITAQEAKEYGIVLDVTSADTLLSRAEQLAFQLAQGPSVTIGLTKSILNRSYEMTLEQVLHEEGFVQGIAFTTHDHQEGVKAFIGKRQPEFKGE